jgi:sialate O-acetylesterase
MSLLLTLSLACRILFRMNITHGLLTGQVLQRNLKNLGGATVTGDSPATGVVEARVCKGSQPVKGWNWRKVGSALRTQFKAQLEAIPAGGPYSVEFRICQNDKIADRLAVRDLYVGDVWFMAGQSNMQGLGNMNQAANPHPMVRCFYMRDEWGIAKDPLHQLNEAVDFVHNGGQTVSREQAEKDRQHPLKGVGVGIFFGIEMVKRTGVPQGLISCAHGGTSMAQWSPALRDEGGKSLYGAMIRRFKTLAQPARGILWYQGESDTGLDTAAIYTQKMKELVAASRKDFKQAQLPWIIAQIGRHIVDSPDSKGWNSIQDQERCLVNQIRNFETVPALDLELDDGIHISSRGYAVLGQRMARMADRLALGNRKEPGSIQLDRIKGAYPAGAQDPMVQGIEISFKNVVGSLQCQGLPAGFVLLDAEGKPMQTCIKTRLEGNKVILETIAPPTMIFEVGYGLGFNPICNVVDSRGMAIPQFGPLPACGQKGSAFLVNWKVSGPFVEQDLNRVTYPSVDRLDWHAPHSVQPILIMPQDVSQAKPGLFYLRTFVQVATALKLKLMMGADGPYRIWINGNEGARNLKASNPSVADQYPHPVEFQAGRNEILIAFDGRKGMGWGISLRFFDAKPRIELAADAVVEEI